MTLLEVRRLETQFRTPTGISRAVSDVTFSIDSKQTVAIVGESGSGKSVTALSILRLIAEPPGKISGEIFFNGRNLLQLSEREMRGVRGNEISMIFQEPMTSLNPVLTVGYQLSEPLRLHQGLGRRKALDRSAELLSVVGIPDARRRLKDYPHQFSGGMRQRLMIAMALACSPKLLIADEPTTALDVTIQAQILDLMRELKDRVGTAILLITHDLGVVAELADKVAVMYAGRIVEYGNVEDLFAGPLHPYTTGLLNAVPKIGAATRQSIDRLAEIPGMVPNLKEKIEGCAFFSRCPVASQKCQEREPLLEQSLGGHSVACFNAQREKYIV